MSTHPRSTLTELLNLMKPMRGILLIAFVIGVLGLLATINTNPHSEEAGNRVLLLAFGGLCAMALVGSILSDIGTIKGFFEARGHEDELQKQYCAISEGAKELPIIGAAWPTSPCGQAPTRLTSVSYWCCCI